MTAGENFGNYKDRRLPDLVFVEAVAENPNVQTTFKEVLQHRSSCHLEKDYMRIAFQTLAILTIPPSLSDLRDGQGGLKASCAAWSSVI